jgi:hypothetical protein
MGAAEYLKLGASSCLASAWKVSPPRTDRDATRSSHVERVAGRRPDSAFLKHPMRFGYDCIQAPFTDILRSRRLWPLQP